MDILHRRTYYAHTLPSERGANGFFHWNIKSGETERAEVAQPRLEKAQGGGKKRESKFFSVVPRDRTRGNGQKLKYRKFHLNGRGSFCAVRVVKHLNRLREIGESPSLQILKTWLDMSWISGWPCSLGLDWTGWAPDVLWRWMKVLQP